jgi:uncharacterized protein
MKRAKKVARLVLSLLIIYVLGGVLLYLLQDWLLFHPEPLARHHQFSFSAPFREVNYTRAHHRNLNLVRFETTTPKKGIVLYFHGNMRNVERYAPFTEPFTRSGYEVWMVDYPGYGKSTGKRSEQVLYQDALFVYQHAVGEEQPSHIIIYGRSIGTGVASYLAAHRPCRQLVLETPYYNIDALARHYFPIYPVMPLTKYSFPINRCLPRVPAPVTLLHGTDDEIVPYRHSVRLKKENPKITLITVPKGKHNNLHDFSAFQQALQQLLAR